MTQDEKPRKKLIEVALPLDAINKASAREKSIRHGHPSTLHLWWARRPLATCRAVLFASLVDDPSEHPELFPTEEAQEQERKRLFDLIEAMVQWKNSNNEEVMARVRAEIRKATCEDALVIRDPFCGGGSIPLEAVRLGLHARATDLNPVAVLITKALIEIPSKFAGYAPVNPDKGPVLLAQNRQGAHGLADDVRYYGKWMRDEAEKRIGHLYPKVKRPKEYGGGETTVIAWLWARTVACPNPACGMQMPLVRSFYLSKKKGKEAWWIEPEVEYTTTPPTLHFHVQTGKSEPPEGTVSKGARCIACNTPVGFDYIRREGKAGCMRAQLMAIVGEGQHGRVYLAPTKEQAAIAEQAIPIWKPEQEMSRNPRWFSPPLYGISTFADIFTSRQLTALNTFSDLVRKARERVLVDARYAGMSADDRALNAGGVGANAYADAVATYLGIAIDRLADKNSTLCAWDVTRDNLGHTFARQAISMVWDFGEANPISNSGGNFLGAVDWVAEVVETSPCGKSEVYQSDATITVNGTKRAIYSTDPPYYDNIGYADLSDFFYVWLRRTLGPIYPDLFREPLTPKETELIASPYRFDGSKEQARIFFEKQLRKVLEDVFECLYKDQHYDYPLTLYYAFKQAESGEEEDGDEKSSKKNSGATGWETMLESLIHAGFTITGTWPARTEMVNRSVGQGTNALASCIVFVCRPRPVEAPIASRRQFLNELRSELPEAVRRLQQGGIAPVDVAQASIGPGMAIYSRYSKVMESDGTQLRVRTALKLINQTLDEVLAEQEGEYDAQTRWAIAWFEEYAHNEGEYGRAETLSKAKNMSLQSLVDAGLLVSRSGKVRLRRRDELSETWHSRSVHPTVWEVMQRMIAALHKDGDQGAGNVLRHVSEQGELARDLAYRLYKLCDTKGWSEEALAYNNLITSWSEISRLARREASDKGLWEATFLG